MKLLFTTLAAVMLLPSLKAQVFTNSSAIPILKTFPQSISSSSIEVSGLTGSVAKVTVTLHNLSDANTNAIDILLVGPGGQQFILMSDAGGNVATTNVTMTFDDAGALALPNFGALASGTFRPTNYDLGDVFPAPAPAGPYDSPAPAASASLGSVFGAALPNGTWTLYVTGDVGSPSPGSIAGGWTLVFTLIPLPLTLTDFRGSNNKSENYLEWSTASEQNASYFEIERSVNGSNYILAGRVKAAGNSNVNKKYSFNDQAGGAFWSVYYYRLKMVDLDGTFSYSKVITIRNIKHGFFASAFMDPVTGRLIVKIQSQAHMPATLRISDLNGRQLFRERFQLQQGENNIDLIQFGRFGPGIYLVNVLANGTQRTLKVFHGIVN